MTSAHPRLPRVSTGIAVAFALAAGPAATQVLTGYLKLDDIAGESQARSGPPRQIEIHSWSFGASQLAAQSGLGSWSKADGLEVNMGQSANAGGTHATFKGEVAGIEPNYRAGGDSKARGGTRTVDKNESITIHGGRTEGDTDRPIIIGSLPNPKRATVGAAQSVTVGAGQSPQMYNPKELTITKRPDWVGQSAPASASRGSLTTLVPAGTCRPGKRYRSAEFGTGERVYRMTNLVVAGCSASVSAHGGDSQARPMESMSLNYDKIVWK